MSTWISVKDKLPENYIPVLCFLRFNDMCPTWDKKVLYFDFKKTKDWYENDISGCVKGDEKKLSDWWDVTHWMPLPEPPTGDK